MNRDSVSFQISEAAEEANRLPPELKAMQTMMDAVFNAVTNAAPREVNRGEAVAKYAQDDRPVAAPGTRVSTVGIASENSSVTEITAPVVAAPRRIDIENAILRAPGFDYLLASEIFAALQRRLEVEYEDRLDMTLETMMQDLATAFDRLTGMGK